MLSIGQIKYRSETPLLPQHVGSSRSLLWNAKSASKYGMWWSHCDPICTSLHCPSSLLVPGRNIVAAFFSSEVDPRKLHWTLRKYCKKEKARSNWGIVILRVKTVSSITRTRSVVVLWQEQVVLQWSCVTASVIRPTGSQNPLCVINLSFR